MWLDIKQFVRHMDLAEYAAQQVGSEENLKSVKFLTFRFDPWMLIM